MPWYSKVLAIHLVILGVLVAAPVPAQSTRYATNADAIAVIVGNQDYADGIPDVLFAKNDARAMRDFVTRVLGFRDGNVIELLDASQAQLISVFGNRDDYRGKLLQYAREGRSDVFIFYSGHGVPGLRDKRGYLLPVDADPGTPELNGYPLDQLLANVEKLKARSVTVVIDIGPLGREIDIHGPQRIGMAAGHAGFPGRRRNVAGLRKFLHEPRAAL